MSSPQRPLRTGNSSAPPSVVNGPMSSAEPGGYVTSGSLTSEELIKSDPAQFKELDKYIEDVTLQVQRELVESGQAQALSAEAGSNPAARLALINEIDRLALTHLLRSHSGVHGADQKYVIASVINEIVGLGPIEALWQDPNITEVIVNGPDETYVERFGRIERARGVRFRSQQHLLDVCQRVLAPLNRKLDTKDPLADGRLPDGSRVNAVHPATAPKGPLLTIRRFPEINRSLVDLVRLGSMNEDMAQTLVWLVRQRASLLVVGGTGSGKALALKTPVPTPDGWTTMGELQVGDWVFDENGEQTEVVGAYDILFNRDVYEVEFVDGTTILADGEHLWPTIPRLAGGKTCVTTAHFVVGAVPLDAYDGRSCRPNGDAYTHKIVAITPVESVPVRCIKVENPKSLFLVGHGFVPTHNTTLLNGLSAAIPHDERVVTIEDSLELRLDPRAHVAAMEGRPPDAGGKNAVGIRALVKNALRMRPDRIIVGEVRDESALEMLQACNTGHEGSMSTVHANGPDEAIVRLSVMVAQGGEIPEDKVEWLVGSALDLMVTVKRYKDGSRRVSGLYEVPTLNNAVGAHLKTVPLWEWERTGTGPDGMFLGEYVQRNEISNRLADKLSLPWEPKPTWEHVQQVCGTGL